MSFYSDQQAHLDCYTHNILAILPSSLVQVCYTSMEINWSHSVLYALGISHISSFSLVYSPVCCPFLPLNQRIHLFHNTQSRDWTPECQETSYDLSNPLGHVSLAGPNRNNSSCQKFQWELFCFAYSFLSFLFFLLFIHSYS